MLKCGYQCATHLVEAWRRVVPGKEHNLPLCLPSYYEECLHVQGCVTNVRNHGTESLLSICFCTSRPGLQQINRFSPSKFSGGKFLFLKLDFNKAWTENFHMYKLPLEKAEKPEIRLPTSAGLEKRQGNSRRISTSASLTVLKPLTVRITTNCGKFLKRCEY